MKKMGDEPAARAKRRREIEEMSEKDMLVEIKKTQADVRERVDCACQRRQESSLGKLPLAMMMLCLVVIQSRLADAFTTYDCSNRSNIVESYSMLEPDACAVSDKTQIRDSC
jgi:hypothetical protein